MAVQPSVQQSDVSAAFGTTAGGVCPHNVEGVLSQDLNYFAKRYVYSEFLICIALNIYFVQLAKAHEHDSRYYPHQAPIGNGHSSSTRATHCGLL